MIGRDEPFAWRAIAYGRRQGLCCAQSAPVDELHRRFICTRDAGHPPPHKAHARPNGAQLAAWIDTEETRP